MEADLNIRSKLPSVEEVWAVRFGTRGQSKATCPAGGNLPEEVSDELRLEGGRASFKGRGRMWAKTSVVSLGRSRPKLGIHRRKRQERDWGQRVKGLSCLLCRELVFEERGERFGGGRRI